MISVPFARILHSYEKNPPITMILIPMYSMSCARQSALVVTYTSRSRHYDASNDLQRRAPYLIEKKTAAECTMNASSIGPIRHNTIIKSNFKRKSQAAKLEGH